ncbi:MAG: hypothetical protein E6I82_00900 [Chloroflexi bacterium]|nr:MAG: hypothetical protein E6I82_00900 [Chloroflexota bacterium]
MGVVRYLDLAEWIRVRSPRAGPSRIVAIDGPAGSGKSVFAARLAHVLTAPVICLDDLTPSWTGPDRETALLVEQILAPLTRGGPARYQFFDWVKDQYTEWRDVAPNPIILAEGVGAGSRIVRPYLTYLIWVEAPGALRLTRGLERDGQARLPEWNRWREREDALFRREETRTCADLTVDGAPSVAHDPAAEFVLLAR